MNYKIVVQNDLDQRLPGYTVFNSQNKKDGGTITLNASLSANEKLEVIYHTTDYL